MKRKRRHRGFTLIELTAAMAVMSVLMLAMSSAILIASRAMPNSNRPATRILQGSAALQQLVEEVATAVAITERGANAISFTVADRDNDGAPERLRYAWANTAGAALTRSYNGSTPLEVATSVTLFNLTYTLRSETETYPGTVIDSAEQLLSSFDSSSSEQNFSVKKEDWIGQLIAPSLPANAESWTINRAKFLMRVKGTADGVTAVQVRAVGAGNLPAVNVLESQVVSEGILTSSYVWREVTYSGNVLFANGANAFVVLASHNNKDDTAEVKHNDHTSGGMVDTGHGDSDWRAESDKSLRHFVYGHYHAPGPDQTAVRRYVTAIGVDLQVGTDNAARMQTSVRTLNEPEVLRAFWELDAGQSLTLDCNGDAAADWNTAAEFRMNPSLLLDGSTSWTIPVTGTIASTAPANDFNDLTTVVVRFRDAVVNTQPAMIVINSDWTGSNNVQIHGRLTLEANATQTLKVTTYDGAGAALPLVQMTGLPASLVELRLLVDPALNTVNVRVNGVEKGTFSYGTIARSQVTKYAQIAPWGGSAAEFARVSIRIGDRTP